MNNITERLQERRNIEVAKSILENAGYKVTKRLSESSDEKTYYVSFLAPSGTFEGKYIDKPYKASSEEEAEEKFRKEFPQVKKQDYKIISPSSHGLEESTESLSSQVKKALDDAGIEYTERRNGSLVVSRKNLDRASEIRNEIDPEYTVTIVSRGA